MAETTNITLTPGDGWTAIATDPGAITLKSNFPSSTYFRLVISASGVPAETLVGEQHPGGTSWSSGGFTGVLYVKAIGSAHLFAVTV